MQFKCHVRSMHTKQHFITAWARSPVPSSRHSQRLWKALEYSESSTSSSTQGRNENSTAHNNTDDIDGQSLQSYGTKNSITIKQSSTSNRATITHSITSAAAKTFTITQPLSIVCAAQNPTPRKLYVHTMCRICTRSHLSINVWINDLLEIEQKKWNHTHTRSTEFKEGSKDKHWQLPLSAGAAMSVESWVQTAPQPRPQRRLNPAAVMIRGPKPYTYTINRIQRRQQRQALTAVMIRGWGYI